MPTSVGRSPTATFNFLYDMIWKRINGVTDRPMSRAGKETFLKSVIQAIPTFVMSCFQIPVSNCDKMRASIANQWWGVEDGKRKLHWRSWDWLSNPKSLGGMGFRDLVLFNQAMLGRQGWRLLTYPTSLCARVLNGRYFLYTDFWNAPNQDRRLILGGVFSLVESCFCKECNGELATENLLKFCRTTGYQNSRHICLNPSRVFRVLLRCTA
jgi:hypothetical protein